MRRKAVSGILLMLLLTSMLNLAFNVKQVKAEPTTWTVDDDGPADFHMIQEAINVASSGDTILVRAGTYIENVKVNKHHLTIKSESGSDVTIVRAADPSDHVFEVTADYVTISGFTVENASGYLKAGIYVYYANYSNIFDNKAQYNFVGILVGDTYSSLESSPSYNALILDNICRNNYFGVLISHSNDNKISNNAYYNNQWIGIALEWYSSDNSITKNTLYENGHGGIYIGWYSENNVVLNNTSYKNGYYGILLNELFDLKAQNLILNNMFENNEYGIWVKVSKNSGRILGNILKSNRYGIYLYRSEYHRIYHNNFVDNVNQAYVLEPFPEGSIYNIWDNGYPSGGNYWSDYKEKYPDAKEIDGSGIWDTPYVIDESNIDRYPLIKPTKGWSSETIYIRTDGSIYPPDASLITFDNITYTLTNNIISSADGIVVERDNVVINGAGYTLQGSGTGHGFFIESNNVTIRRTNILGFESGISFNSFLYYHTITENTIRNNRIGITLGTFYSRVEENIIEANEYGIWLTAGSRSNNITKNTLRGNTVYGLYFKWSWSWAAGHMQRSSGNIIWLNNFYDEIWVGGGAGAGYYNTWNSIEEISYFYNGRSYKNYLGNYWAYYTGSDADENGIGDTPFDLNPDDKDNYPLMKPFENYMVPPLPNQPPHTPIAVSQLMSDRVTVIPEGGTTPESMIIFKAIVSDPDEDMVQLEIELRQIGEAFTGEPTPETISVFVPSGTEVSITRYGLINGEYHWQYRARDIKGAVSEWKEFEAMGNVDFTIQHVYQPPIARLDFYPAEPKAGESVILDASASFVDGQPFSFTWDLNNDGIFDYISDGPKVEVSWSKSGQYEVKVTVTDWHFEKSSDVETIYVSPSFIERENNLEFTFLPEFEWKIGYTELNIIKEFLNISNGFGPYGNWEVVDREDYEVCKRLYRFTDTDFLLGLNSLINQEGLSDLTLGTYILNAKGEMDTVEYVRSQKYKLSADNFWYTYTRINEGWAWLALDLSIQTLINLIPEPITRTAVGLICISMKFYQRYEGLMALKKELFYNDLWTYLELRSQGEDHYSAWNVYYYRSFVKSNKEIEEYFKHLGDTYGVHLTGIGLKEEFKANMRKNLRQTLLSAICDYKHLPDRIKEKVYSPVNVRIYDSKGRITGLVDEEIKEEIPYSAYDNETKTIVVFLPADPNSYRYEIAGHENGSYGLDVISILQGEISSFSATNIPISANTTHQYAIDWFSLSEGAEGVIVMVDSDGDGLFEHSFTSDSELTQNEYMSAMNAIDTWITDSDFNKIDDFRAVFTPYGDTGLYKLTATNPGQFYFNILVNNTWSETLNLTIIYLIDADFALKGARPIHIYSDLNRTIDITDNCTFSDNAIILYNVAPNDIIYITIHLEYALKGTTWTEEEVKAWYSEHEFNATLNSITSKAIIIDPELQTQRVPLYLIFFRDLLLAIMLCLGFVFSVLKYRGAYVFSKIAKSLKGYLF